MSLITIKSGTRYPQLGLGLELTNDSPLAARLSLDILLRISKTSTYLRLQHDLFLGVECELELTILIIPRHPSLPTLFPLHHLPHLQLWRIA